MRLGDTFRFTITIDAPQADSIPDLIPLQENFSIIGTERSMAYSIINGQRHSVNQWTVLLIPLKTGTLLIPAIQIGQQQTKATSIQVIDSSPSTTSTSPVTSTCPLRLHLLSNKAMIYRMRKYG